MAAPELVCCTRKCESHRCAKSEASSASISNSDISNAPFTLCAGVAAPAAPTAAADPAAVEEASAAPRRGLPNSSISSSKAMEPAPPSSSSPPMSSSKASKQKRHGQPGRGVCRPVPCGLAGACGNRLVEPRFKMWGLRGIGGEAGGDTISCSDGGNMGVGGTVGARVDFGPLESPSTRTGVAGSWLELANDSWRPTGRDSSSERILGVVIASAAAGAHIEPKLLSPSEPDGSMRPGRGWEAAEDCELTPGFCALEERRSSRRGREQRHAHRRVQRQPAHASTARAAKIAATTEAIALSWCIQSGEALARPMLLRD